jgi:hypothetical protein
VKRKVGTVLDERLLRKAKQVAAREKKPLSVLLEEALDAHLVRLGERPAGRPGQVVEETAGALRIDKKRLTAILKEEGVFETR